MEGKFKDLIDQVPKDVYSDSKAIISENIAIFKPRAFILNKTMCSEDYSFILASCDLPPANIGKKEIHLGKNSLVTIGSGVEFSCKTYMPAREYVNIVIKKNFLEEIASNITGKSNIDFSKVEYGRSKQFLRILSDLESELVFNNDDCQLMVQSLTTQLVIQLLRDTGSYTRNYSNVTGEYIVNSEYDPIIYTNPDSYFILSYYNKLLPENKLTKREIEIASFLIDRFDYNEISKKLFISRNTLKTHAKNIYKKCNVSGRKELSYRISKMYFES
ncbi:MAG: DNA-binding protein AraC-type [Sedimentibacter sp.]|jgi:DNA-binding CsgD family transcriptional regulator|nr:DNA-binding protein AraC-type [Sedimentibacter sp.]